MAVETIIKATNPDFLLVVFRCVESELLVVMEKVEVSESGLRLAKVSEDANREAGAFMTLKEDDLEATSSSSISLC